MSDTRENSPTRPIPADESPGGILRDAFVRAADLQSTTRAVDTGAIPERIGRYAIKGVIASGGMGTVYHAVQEQPRRIVALKIMNSGIASRSALRRFEFEAQTLARLRHPNIAQVYEAGTHDDGRGGVPFFAMEYVPGAKTLTEYAEARKLGARERLKLFARVCDAVHHGHQKGIIHRDLKPSNILVDSAGQPKIIDFGVARATDSDLAVTTLQTDIGQLIGTLQYMSPEQCDADPHDLDTRSDVYSLGVVLYELLCGHLPYDVSRSALHEAARIIREEAPVRPSSIDRTMRGDVETIALKALEKERERRYQSAAQLAQDIGRYLANEPIAARPPSASYRLRRFISRHRGPLAAALVILVLLVAGATVSTTGWIKAVERRRAAEAQAATARDALVGIVHQGLRSGDKEAIPDLAAAAGLDLIFEERDGRNLFYVDIPPGEEVTQLAAFAGQILQWLETSRRQAEAELAAEAERVTELERVVLGGNHAETLASINDLAARLNVEGRYVEAERLMRGSVETSVRILGDRHWLIAEARSLLGEALAGQARYDEAEPLLVAGHAGMASAVPAEQREEKIRAAIERLVRLYEAWNKPGEAAEWRFTLAQLDRGGTLRP